MLSKWNCHIWKELFQDLLIKKEDSKIDHQEEDLDETEKEIIIDLVLGIGHFTKVEMIITEKITTITIDQDHLIRIEIIIIEKKGGIDQDQDHLIERVIKEEIDTTSKEISINQETDPEEDISFL